MTRVLLIAACALLLFAPAAATMQGIQVGMEAPELTVRDGGGEPRSFADLKGEKLTAIVFWSTTSRKSEPLLARMEQLYARYRQLGFAVIAVNVDDQHGSGETAARAKEAAQKLGLSFPVVLDNGLKSFHDFGVIALPSTVVVDRERVARYELSGYPLVLAEALVEFIETTLGVRQAPAARPRPAHEPDRKAVRLFNMGKASLRSKRLAATAEEWFRKAVTADPKFALPRLALGRLYLERGEVPRARQEFERLLSLEPDHPVALCELGLILVNEGKVPEGEVLLARGRTLADSYPLCYSYTGYSYGKSGRLEEGLKLFDEAAKLNPGDYDSQVLKGKMYEELGQQGEAAAAYRKGLEIILGLN